MTSKLDLTSTFQSELVSELDSFLMYEKNRFPKEERLKIDLHCHDYNSDVPDELLGRILNVPETWLKTKKLVETLQRNNVDVITVTNHNNARSCYELQSKGHDVLVGAEFSCTVPDFNIGIHVLTYGFTAEQEVKLNKLRRNLYQFLRYANEHNIPAIWAHPLYHYSKGGLPPMEFFNKLSLVFERFEVLNGQRDTWQNLLVHHWLKGLTPEMIDQYAAGFSINPYDYCRNPYKKSLSGGSDSHMGIFAGQTGSYLFVPDLGERRKGTPLSELALEAIRLGRMAPYGSHQNAEKLTIAFLDYVCQIALHKQDPGLMRIMLHKGDYRDKLTALLVTNGFAELRRHKVTMRFVNLFHDCFLGKSPSKAQRMAVPKVYKPVFDEALKISKAQSLEPDKMVQAMNQSLNTISQQLNTILYSRLSKKIEKLTEKGTGGWDNFNAMVEKLEIPSEFRALTGGGPQQKKSGKNGRMTRFAFGEFMDGLSFPFLASFILQGANYASTRALYNNRELLSAFSSQIGKLQHPKRMLWLTDTFEERNGVSTVLHQFLEVVRERNLPIDLLVCSNKLKPGDHLLVVKPMAEFGLPFYDHQPIRVPNVMEVHNLFLERSYDRVICSTEGVMGMISLYLKNAFSVKAHFYVHTDWVMFARKVLDVDTHNLNRIRRLLRAFYKSFDSLFVLNTDQQKWLSGGEMELDERKIHLTAHWADKIFEPKDDQRQSLFGVKPSDKVLLYAGRLSKEKGVPDIPAMVEKLKPVIPNLKVVFAGSGPAEKELKKELPNAIFLGWVEHGQLPAIYSSADLLVLPSKFDTFSCVVLEALSCGLPVVAYKSKGPKDILANGDCGFLAGNKNEMTALVASYFNNQKFLSSFKQKAVEHAKMYSAQAIVDDFVEYSGL